MGCHRNRKIRDQQRRQNIDSHAQQGQSKEGMKKRPMRLFLSEDADTQENDGPEKNPRVGAIVQDG